MALGQLVEGKWVSKREQEDSKGRFLRPSTTFRDRISADGSSGFKAESGRYPYPLQESFHSPVKDLRLHQKRPMIAWNFADA